MLVVGSTSSHGVLNNLLAEPVLAYANKEGHVIFTGAEKIALPARTAVQVAGIVNDHYNDLTKTICPFYKR